MATGPGSHSHIGVHDVNDINQSKSAGLHLDYAFTNLPLRLGATLMRNNIPESAAGGLYGMPMGGTLANQTISAVEMGYNRDKFGLMTEYYRISNDSKMGDNLNTAAVTSTGHYTGSAYYVQMSYQMTPTLKPVYRYESVAFQQGYGYFDALGAMEEKRHVLALRWDLDDTNALKFEANRGLPSMPGAEATTRYAIQWAFMIN